MALSKHLLLPFLLLFCGTNNIVSAQKITGHVSNAAGKSLPFATIKLGGSQRGLVADLQGDFTLVYNAAIQQIEVSYAGYASRRLDISADTKQLDIILDATAEELSSVVVASKSSKVKRIMNKVLANKDKHNPDKYDQYRCSIYYKMIVDVNTTDSLSFIKDTTRNFKKYQAQRASKHLFLTETKSIRHWKRPQQLQEEVLASRMSGFKTPLINSFITDVLPFHSYGEFIVLNGKDYNSPVSRGLFQRFNYTLADELLQGEDTIWVINFKPKKDVAELSGTLYISSNGYAIKNLLAYAKDPVLRRDLGIEQQYAFEKGKWFPSQLNYSLSAQFGDSNKASFNMWGTSFIDSVQWKEEKAFRFSKAYTVKVQPGANRRTDSQWLAVRPQALDNRELRTYVYMDSLSDKQHWDRYLNAAGKIAESKISLGQFDLMTNKIFSYNRYEKSRLGIGLQTNEKIATHLSVGAWAGYGFGDKNWKYGAFTEWYLDQYKDHMLRFAYNKDIIDPGRLQIHKDLNNNYVRQFLMFRVDDVRSYTLSLQNRLGYFATQLSGTYSSIRPQYRYALQSGNKFLSRFTNYEAILDVRYAFAEKRVPFFGRYYNSGTKYPILYGRVNIGTITENNITYAQALAAVSWRKHLNRIGLEKFLLIGAVSQSNKALPLSKIFAGNGFLGHRQSLHFFGGMQTIRPYDYYMDRFINFYWEHKFDFHLYKLKITKERFSSAPSIGLGANFLLGNMKYESAHQFVDFKVPEKGYMEAGALLNDVLQIKYLNLYYLGLNIGYYYHIESGKTLKENGRFVFGIGIDF